MHIVSFGELVTSNAFIFLLKRVWTLSSSYLGLGIYNQGIPISNVIDLIWGTNAGIRTLPMLTVFTILQKIFPTLWVYIYFALSIILPFPLFILACKLLKKIDIWVILGALLYTFNPWIIGRLLSGFWQLNIVYAFLPFLVTIVLRVTKEEKVTKNFVFFSVLYGAIASIILIAQPHFLVFSSLFAIAYVLVFLIKKDIRHVLLFIKFFLLAGCTFFVLNLYFILPSILFPEKMFTAPGQYFSLASVMFNSTCDQVGNVLKFNTNFCTAQSTLPWWVLVVQWFPITLVGIIWIINKKRSWLFAVLIGVFLFLSKGLMEPLSGVSTWIYNTIFFMSYFRDPSRFLAIVILLCSLIIATATIQKKMNVFVSILLVLIGAGICIVINIPIFQSGSFTFLQGVTVPSDYYAMQSYINTHIGDGDLYRILILPNNQNMEDYSWYTSQNPVTTNLVFDMLAPLDIPIANSDNQSDSYGAQMSAFIYQQYTQSFNPSLLAPLGVKYVLLDNSITAPVQDADVVKNAMSVIPTQQYTLLYKIGSLYLYQVNNPQPITSISKPVFAIGDLNTVLTFAQEGMHRPVILLNQEVNSAALKQDILKGQDLFVDPSFTDPNLTLTAEALSSSFSADILHAGWNDNKLFQDAEAYKTEYINYTGDLFTSGSAVTSRYLTGTMRVPDNLSAGKYEVLAKAFTFESPSYLGITIGDNTIHENILTNNALTWEDFGSVTLTHPVSYITLRKTDGQLLILDDVKIVPETVFTNEEDTITHLLNAMHHVSTAVNPASLDYTNNITSDSLSTNVKSAYLSYNFSYGQNWSANAQATEYISDGYGMTFISNKNNLTTINYFPDVVYRVSLVISALGYIGACVYISWMLYKRKVTS